MLVVYCQYIYITETKADKTKTNPKHKIIPTIAAAVVTNQTSKNRKKAPKEPEVKAK